MSDLEVTTCLDCGARVVGDNGPCNCRGFRKEDLKDNGVIWCPLRGHYLETDVCSGPNCLDPAMRPVCWDDVAPGIEVDTP